MNALGVALLDLRCSGPGRRTLPAALLVALGACTTTATRTVDHGDGSAGADASAGSGGTSDGSAGTAGATGGTAGASGGAAGASGGAAGASGGAAGGTGASGGSGGSLAADAGGPTRTVPGANQSFNFSLRGVSASASFTHSFEADAREVDVGRFTAWVHAGQPVPCAADGESGCRLDAGGPYDSVMLWHHEWNVAAQRADHFVGAACDTPLPYGTATYGRGQPALPMTCVSWYQALAFCAFEGKRLPTSAEWVYAATGHGQGWLYAWGSTPSPPDCAHAVVRDSASTGCGFPLVGGSAPGGASVDGLDDLTGSVFEWVWDADWDVSYPSGTADFSGPAFPVTGDPGHYRHGGAFMVPDFTNDLRLESGEPDLFSAAEFYADAGFRCVKTVP